MKWKTSALESGEDRTKHKIQASGVLNNHESSQGAYQFRIPANPIMTADGSRPLRMVDCMCGSNCPVASACAWIGWAIFTAELLGTPYHPGCNLLETEKRKQT